MKIVNQAQRFELNYQAERLLLYKNAWSVEVKFRLTEITESCCQPMKFLLEVSENVKQNPY